MINTLIEKVKSDPAKLIDFALFLLLSIPYASMLLSFKYFEPFFGLGMISFFPVGAIVVIVQVVMNKRMNHMDAAQFTLGVITMLIGSCTLMLTYIVLAE